VIKDTFGFPSEIARENYPKQDKRAEERRLFYVAISRAKEELV
jgi:superfamily I DNA/RNA helicase